MSYAQIWVFEKDKVAESPHKSSFGSFEFNPDLSLPELEKFINEVCKKLIHHKCHTFYIRSWPHCYNPAQFTILHSALLQSGFTVKTTDLNFHLEINEKPFIDKIDSSEKWILNKCKKNKFYFDVLDPVKYLEEVYNFLSVSVRKHKDELSMSFFKLSDSFKQFPENYFLFGVFNNENKLLSASVGVRINASIFYIFYLGYEVQFSSFSPMVLLMEGIYNFCRENKYEIMDLGIATEKGVPNYGLIHFKRNLGGIAGFKLSYEKQLGIKENGYRV